MITWMPFKGTKQEIKNISILVGANKKFKSCTNEFLVVAKFISANTDYKQQYEIRFARISDNEVSVNGMMGMVSISHWSISNMPKDVNR